MIFKWTVRKRDGAWQAFDAIGDLRYASSNWRATVDFALIGGHEMPDTKPLIFRAMRHRRFGER